MQSLVKQQKMQETGNDFRIKYSSRGINDSPVRNKALMNSQNGAALLRMSTGQHLLENEDSRNGQHKTVQEAESEEINFGAASSKSLMEISKIRKLEEARKKWEIHHSSNSPFRVDQFSASPLTESQNSPFTVSKGLGYRHEIDQMSNTSKPSQFMPVNKQDFSSTFKQQRIQRNASATPTNKTSNYTSYGT